MHLAALVQSEMSGAIQVSHYEFEPQIGHAFLPMIDKGECDLRHSSSTTIIYGGRQSVNCEECYLEYSCEKVR